MLLTKRLTACAGSCVCLLALVGAARAQEGARPAPPAPKVAPTAPVVKVKPSEFAARNIARVVFADLGLQNPPLPRDHKIALAMIGLVQKYWDTEQTLRWRLGAAVAAQDDATAIAMCKEILRRDPSDTVIQYRLISLLVDDAKTADSRLARLTRFLGPDGASLDPTVRSRLSMDAGALCQQLGDEAGFVAHLKEATALDITNRDAAAAAAAYFAERVDDPIGRLELLGNLLIAEPTDPETQMAISRELVAIGAFEEASRFQANVENLLEHERVPVPPMLARERLFTRWGTEGPQSVVNEINKQVEGYRQQTARRIEQLEEQLLSTQGIPKPEEVRLEILMERVRLIAAVAAHDQETTRKSVSDFRATAVTRIKELSDPRTRPEDVDEGKAKDLIVLMKLGVLEAMSWANVYAPPPPPPADTKEQGKGSPPAPVAPATATPPAETFDNALAEVEKLAVDESIDAGNLDYITARGWAMIRAGKIDEAIPMLESVGDQRVGAQLGLGEAYRLKGDKEKAIEAYRLIWRGVPQSLEATFAYTILRELLGRKDVDQELVRRARVFAGSVPSWIDSISEGGQTLMSLEVDAQPRQARGLEPSSVKIRLRNLAPVALGLGTDRTLNSQMLVGSSMEVGMSSVRAYLTPEVTSVGKRFRLKPNESIETEYWPDAGSAGWVVEECCGKSVRQRWRVVQGYIQAEDGTISTGPLCLSRESGSQVRLPVAEALLSNAELASRLESAGEEDLPGVLAMIRARMLNPQTDATGITTTVPDAEVAAFAAAAVKRYPSLGVPGRLMFAAVLPQGGLFAAFKAFDELLLQESDPDVRMVVLITRITDAASPFLAACESAPDARVSELARLMKERISGGFSGYAERGGPDVHGIIQDSRTDMKDDGLGLSKGPLK